MQWLRQSTQVIVPFGTFVDKTDGVALETGLAAAMDNATTGIRVRKQGGSFADRNSATVPAYDAMGGYNITLSATDTDTLGHLRMVFEEAATALPVWADFLVVPANVYDSLVLGTDTLNADLTQIGGVTQSATDLKDFADAGYDPATNQVQGVVLVDTTTDNTDMVSEAPTVGQITTELNANLAVQATALDNILKSSTFALAIADAIADEVLTGSTHNIVNSLVRSCRQ